MQYEVRIQDKDYSSVQPGEVDEHARAEEKEGKSLREVVKLLRATQRGGLSLLPLRRSRGWKERRK